MFKSLLKNQQIKLTSVWSISSLNVSSSSLAFKSKNKTISNQTKLQQLKTSAAQKALDILYAKFFIGCNVFYRSSHNSTLFKFVKNLLPGYDPPNRKTFSTKLLNNIYEEIIKTIFVYIL